MTKIVIITGLSGSGKSTALHALEDLDFYAIDNLPIKLLPKLVELVTSTEGKRGFALVMDLRDPEFATNFRSTFESALQTHPELEILVLESSDECLMRRFSETRRKHPASSQSVTEGIRKERELLHELKELSTAVIDTSEMDVHRLKQRVSEQFGGALSHKLQIRIVSFGYKYGNPKNCDLLLDVRFLKNPHFVPQLKANTGLDADVQQYIETDPRFEEFIEKTCSYLEFLIPQYYSEGKKYTGIGIGCTGGKHRSVFSAITLAARLRARLQSEYAISVEHQDVHLRTGA